MSADRALVLLDGWLGPEINDVHVCLEYCVRPRGHHNVICPSAPVHATLAQPAAGADALKEKIRARARVDARAHASLKIGARIQSEFIF